MRPSRFAALFLSTTVGIGLSPAWGKTTAPSAPAAPAAANGSGIGDIVVTAQRRSQRLQDVPAAVSAIDSSMLKAKGITDSLALMGQVPSLQVTTPYGKAQPNFALRGISVANEFSASTASPIGVYVDEVYQSFRASHGQQLYDIDRVEVLRGPQGTLYGRNTTGGAISFFTKKPSLSGDNGYVTLGYGNYNTFTAQGAAEFTLIPDQLGVRFAGTYAKGGGWQYNPLLDQHVGTTDSMGGRMSVRWKPSPDFEANLKLYIARDNPRGANAYSEGQLANGEDALGYSRYEPQTALGGAMLGKNEVATDVDGHQYVKSEGVALNLRYNISNEVTLTSITGYDTGRYINTSSDCDGSPDDLCNVAYNSRSQNFNEDLRFNFKHGPLNLVTGFYYGVDTVKTHNTPSFFGVLRSALLDAGLPGTYNNAAIATPDALKTVPAFYLNPALTPSDPGFCAPVTINPNGFLDARSLIALQTDIAANNTGNGGSGGAASAACRAAGAPPFSPILTDQRYNIKRPSKAIYVDASYDLTDKLTLTGGLRYTWDKVEFYDGVTTLYDLAGDQIVTGLIPYSNPYDPSLAPMRQTQSEKRLTGRANVSYKFARDIMGYIQYSRGYRSGSFNGLAYQGVNQVYYIQPEQVNAYEAGLKTRLFDRHVQLNLAGFYYDYKNQQFTQVVGATTFTRSGNGRLFGGEAELTIQATRRLRLDAALGLLNSKYTGNKIDPDNPASATLNINGNPFPNAPGITFNGSASYDIIDNERDKLTLEGDAAYMGKYYFDPFKNYGQSPCNEPAPGYNILQAGPAIACGNPGYWLINSRLTYKHGNYSISAWVKNMTNKYYYIYGLNINVFGLDYLNRGQPRTFGLEATMNF